MAGRHQDSAELVHQAQFRALFDAHVSYVASSLGRLGIAVQDRDDLVSEVFVRVHRQLDHLDPARPVRRWLFAFAARVASEHRRLARHRRELSTSDFDNVAGAQAPDQNFEMREAMDIVGRALEVLDDDRRAVFVLHDIDEVPVPEIARALGLPEGTAYSRLRAARAQFAAAVRYLSHSRPVTNSAPRGTP